MTEEPSVTSDSDSGELTTEAAQLAFADIYDGDYVMAELIKKSHEIAMATLTLFAARPKPPSTREVSFQAESGPTSLNRPAKMPPLHASELDSTIVRVRNGRVEGFS